jgi:hypothetical protein
MSNRIPPALLALLLSGIAARTSLAAVAPRAPIQPPSFLDDDADDKPAADTNPATTPQAAAAPASERCFPGLLDHRSSYGNDFFHDPFLGPEFDAERQIQFDWIHGQAPALGTDQVDGGFQWNLAGQLTIAADFGWQSDRSSGQRPGNRTATATEDNPRRSTSGLQAVDLAAYHPLYQYVSPDKRFDYTAAARIDLGIPTRTPASATDVQLTPYLGQLLRLGDHISVEAWTGSQFTIGPRQTTYFIYGLSCGYVIPHTQLPIPCTDSLTPIVELDGKTPFSGDARESLFAVTGFDLGFPNAGPAEPHLEIGYEFPLDQGARTQLHWGIIAELFVQF